MNSGIKGHFNFFHFVGWKLGTLPLFCRFLRICMYYIGSQIKNNNWNYAKCKH